MNAADVIAYQYGDDGIYCTDHIVHVLPTGEGEEFDGWAVATGAKMTPAENLAELAHAFGLTSERDPARFPQPVFATADNLTDLTDRVCGWQMYSDDSHTIGERL